MKTKALGFLLLLFLVGSVFISSCSKDDTTPAPDVNLLYGLWTLDNYDYDVLINDVTPLVFIEAELGITGSIAQSMIDVYMTSLEEEMDLPTKIELKENGTYVATFEGSSDDGNWTSTGSILSIDPGTVDETKLTIISLVAKKLVVQMKDTILEDITEDGTDETLAISVDMTFIK